MNRRLVRTLCWLMLLGLFSAAPLMADDYDIPDKDDDSHRPTNVQVMLGAAGFSALDLEYQSSTDPAVKVSTDFTWMPLIGVDGGVELYYYKASFGIEGGAIVSWQTDSVKAAGGNGQVYIKIDNDLYLIDLYLGPYVSKKVHDRVRVYGGLGPLLMIGDNKTSADNVTLQNSNSSTAFGAGIYGRAGVEFKLKGNSWMGLGVRAYTSRLNFSNVSGPTDLNAIQLMITYSLDI